MQDVESKGIWVNHKTLSWVNVLAFCSIDVQKRSDVFGRSPNGGTYLILYAMIFKNKYERATQ